MAVVPSSKTSARLEARIPVETKELLQRAADLEGRSLTDFVIGTVQMEAYRVIERHKTLKLSLEDSKVFVDALLDSPEPNDALKKAKLRCEQVMPV